MEKGTWQTARDDASVQYAGLSVQELREKRRMLETARAKLKPFGDCVKDCAFSTANVHFAIIGKIVAIDEIIEKKQNTKKSDVEQTTF